jgi:hypothetical protein
MLSFHHRIFTHNVTYLMNIFNIRTSMKEVKQIKIIVVMFCNINILLFIYFIDHFTINLTKNQHFIYIHNFKGLF